MPTSQFFLVRPPVDGVVDPSAAAKRVSKLSLKIRCAYKRGLHKMDPHAPKFVAVQKSAVAQEAAAAAVEECAECKALRAKVLAAAPWHCGPHLKLPSQRRRPPSL